MAKMNNVTLLIDQVKHKYLTKKRRKSSLTLNYLQGLELEYTNKAQKYKENKLQIIERHYEEDTEVIRIRLDGKHENVNKKANLLKKFDEKAYWKRRRFKTKNKNSNTLDEMLQSFDIIQKEERSSFVKNLESKYNITKYSEAEINNFKNLILKQQNKRNNKISKLETKVLKLEVKNLDFIKKLKSKQENLKHKIDELSKKILVLSENKNLSDKKVLAEITAELENNQLNDKQRFRLIESKNNYENSLLINENHDIHLSVSNLKMYFGGIKAVNDLSFEVKKGEIFGLIGPNGAGKTTVFNCITQFYKPTGGSIYFRNKESDIVDLNKLKTHDMINEGIARSFQNVELIWELTVLDNLLVSAHSLLLTDYLSHMIHSKKMKREENVLRNKGYQILKDLKIEEYAFRSPYGLPYGVLKKVELARTLMTDPTLIILDEPAAGLNDIETIELAETIKYINKNYGITIFLVEHDMGLVMSICERVCAISFGKKLAIDNPKGIQNNHDVRVAYLGEDDDE